MNSEITQNLNDSNNISSLRTKRLLASNNKGMIKLIDPFLNEINDDNYKLKRRRQVNYNLGCDYAFSDENSNCESNKKQKKTTKRRAEKDQKNSDDEDVIYYLKKKIQVLRKKDNILDSGESKNKNIFKTISCAANNKTRKNTNTELNLFDLINGEKASAACLSLESDELSEVHTDDEFIELRSDVNFDEFKKKISQEIEESKILIEKLETEFFKAEEKLEKGKSKYSDDCIPICADIRTFDFKLLAQKQMKLANGKLFDAIMMDPPWQLSSSQPTRGVAIAYDTLSDNIITELPIDILQKEGFIFIWTINAKFKTSLDLMRKWGYSYHDEIVWVKQTVHGKIAKGHGYYLQHTKETCLVGKKGNPVYQKDVMCDVIFSRRRGQSQKPEEIYKFIEALIPDGFYLEIFGRRNNLRKDWITLGNEL